MPSPNSITIRSGFASFNFAMMAFAVGARSSTPTVEGKPQSRKLAVAIAPWSAMFNVSRKQATPDSFPAATRSPARVACLINSVAATVVPPFLPLPTPPHRRRLAELSSRAQTSLSDVQHVPVFVTGEANHFQLDRIAQTRVMSGATPDPATHVQEM